MGLCRGVVAARGCSVAPGRGAACRRAGGAAWCCTGELPGAVQWGCGRARGAACGCTGAQRRTEQGRCVWPCTGVACGCKGAHTAAQLGCSGGVRGRGVGLCRTGAGAWAGPGVTQGAQVGSCMGAACSCAKAWHAAALERSFWLRWGAAWALPVRCVGQCRAHREIAQGARHAAA